MDRAGSKGEPPPPREAGSRLDTLLRAGSLSGLLLLGILIGALATVGEIFPGPQIARAYQGGMALYSRMTQYHDVYTGDLWFPERRGERGVTIHAPDKAQQGLTLYLSGHEPAAFLIDMQGRLVHRWHRPFSTVWQAGAGGVARPQPDRFVYFRTAKLFPNGDLLAIYEGNGDTPYGYGVVKLDRDSNLLWRYLGRAHHDLDVGPDGKIYVLTHEIVERALDRLDHLKPPRLDDFLVVLSPEGEELKKIALLPAVAKSKYRHMLYTVSSFAVADPLHANAVDVLDEESAASFPFGDAGQVLLSFRELNGLAVLDLEREEIVWAMRGPWIGQHDPDVMANGNLLLFDNYGNYSEPEGISRVIEFDPRTSEIVWQYAGTPDRPLDSRIRADQQRLANGNTLITESNGGRLVEVTPDGAVAWEFVNPVRGGEEGRMIPTILWAERLDPAALDPAFLARP